MRKLLGLFLIGLLGLILLRGGVWFIFEDRIAYEPQAVEQVKPVKVTYTQEPELMQIANALSLEHTDFNLTWGDKWAYKEWASYTLHDIKINPNAPNIKTSIAHEYLHHLWFTKFDYRKLDRLSVRLENVYELDINMQIRMDWYRDNGLKEGTRLFTSELFAIYCTERFNYVMNNPDLCDEYILGEI